MNSSGMKSIEALVEALRNCTNLVVLTGAGVSAESGVPTFREAQTGLWSQYSPEELATPEAFAADPTLVWNWYQSRRKNLATVKPNPGHIALAELEQRLPSCTLITQNVDGLHQQAGSQAIIEFHGNIHRTVCSAKPCEGQWQHDDREPPECPVCGAFLRPDVVWFGESIPEDALNDSLIATRQCDLFISAGTSALVHPAAGLASMAQQNGAIVAEINLEATPATSFVDISISGKTGEILPLILQQV